MTSGSVASYWVPGAGKGGLNGELLAMSVRFLFGVMHMFRNYIMMMVAHLRKNTKNHLTVCFKRVNSVICKF